MIEAVDARLMNLPSVLDTDRVTKMADVRLRNLPKILAKVWLIVTVEARFSVLRRTRVRVCDRETAEVNPTNLASILERV